VTQFDLNHAIWEFGGDINVQGPPWPSLEINCSGGGWEMPTLVAQAGGNTVTATYADDISENDSARVLEGLVGWDEVAGVVVPWAGVVVV
jgi:hypothetical protein